MFGELAGKLLQHVSNCLKTTAPLYEQVRWSTRTTKLKPYFRAERANYLQFLTPANKKFLKKYTEHLYKENKSPLIEQPLERGTWAPESRRVGLICKKIGVIPQWDKNGHRFLVTMLQVADNHVINFVDSDTWYKSSPNGRRHAKHPRSVPMGCCVVGADSGDPQWFKAHYRAMFEKAGCMPKRRLVGFAVSPNSQLQPGTRLFATHFKVGQYVDCFAKSIGHGFQGVVRRWHVKIKPCKHRHSTRKSARRIGAIGCRAECRVHVGKKMPGHMGMEWRQSRGLKIWRINTKYNVLYVHGTGVPGPTHHYVLVKDSIVQNKKVENPPFPTHFPEEDKEPMPEELFDSDLYQFSDPTISFDHLPDIDITPVYTKVKRQAKAKK